MASDGFFFCCSGFLTFLLFAALASALCFWFARVAPVRGGTYFLCRRKESKQRKRAHTASTCSYPRAPNVPTLHSATFCYRFVANASATASPASIALSTARASACHVPICGKRCVGPCAAERAVLAKKFCAPTSAARQPTHRLPQGGARIVRCDSLIYGPLKRMRRWRNALATKVSRCTGARRMGTWRARG